MFVMFSPDILTLLGINLWKSAITITTILPLAFGNNLFLWITILLSSIFAIIGINVALIFYLVNKKISAINSTLQGKLANSGGANKLGEEDLNKIITTAGYDYDPKQDIFYSNMEAWQRKMGYCKLYDEASAPLGMIVDCEPIFFNYAGKRWLIEFWKGQYDLTTGCEIGVYLTDEPDIDIPGIFKGGFYHCASNNDCLNMVFSLKKNGETLFKRKDRHWWLTGFKLGEFSEPSELTMNLKITLKDKEMCNAFVKGLKNVGYTNAEINIIDNSVSLKFSTPHTPQPITRTKETDRIIQRKNKLLCDKYKEIIGPYDELPDKINAVYEQAPSIYEKIINIGKTKQFFKIYEKLQDYLN